MQKYFYLKYNCNNILAGTIVICITNTYHNSYLIKPINYEIYTWVSKYDIYPIIDHDLFFEWSYNKNIQIKIPSDFYIIKNHNIIVKLLIINNDIYEVLNLDTDKIININKNNLIQINSI